MNLDRLFNDALTRVFASINGRVDRALVEARLQAIFTRRSVGQINRYKGVMTRGPSKREQN